MMEMLQELAGPIIAAAVLLGLWLALRTRATRFSPDSPFDSLLGRGDPVVLEFFGNT